MNEAFMALCLFVLHSTVLEPGFHLSKIIKYKCISPFFINFFRLAKVIVTPVNSWSQKHLGLNMLDPVCGQSRNRYADERNLRK